MDYSWSPCHSRFFATPFAGIVSGLGIICGPIWGSFVVLGSFAGRDYLRGRTERHYTIGLLITNRQSTFFLLYSVHRKRGKREVKAG